MDKVQLLNDISHSFDEPELKEICLRLNVNYEHISGANLRDKSRELILYLERRDHLPELVQIMVSLRPNLQATYGPVLTNAGPDTAVPRPITPPPSTITAAPVERQNPFTFGPMVTQKEMFYGRGTELRRLQTRLRNMGSCSIVGMRRVGKSSLLHYLSHFSPLADDAKFKFAYLDLQDSRYQTLHGLIAGALMGWNWYFQSDLELPFGSEFWQQDKTSVLTELANAVRTLRQKNFHPVLCLDEFENLVKRPHEFSDDVFESWRALANAGHVAFVTVSQHPLADLIQQSELTSNFYNIFDQTTLALLSQDEARALVQEPAARQGVTFREDDVTFLLDLCGPHPFYLQMAAFQLFDMMSVGAVNQAQLREDFVWAAERHWQGLWGALTPEEQTAFPLAETVVATPETEYYRTTITRKGLLVKVGNDYKPFSQGFANWVQTTQRPGLTPADPQPVPKNVQTTDTPPTTHAPQTEKTPSAMDKGLLVLTVVVTLVILVVVALVLRFILEVKEVGSLVLLLAILLPFILVLVGSLTGQDFLAWLRDLLGKNQ